MSQSWLFPDCTLWSLEESVHLELEEVREGMKGEHTWALVGREALSQAEKGKHLQVEGDAWAKRGVEKYDLLTALPDPRPRPLVCLQ